MSAFIAVLNETRVDGVAEALSSINIERFVVVENLSAFVHLVCNSVLLSQARFSANDYEASLASEIEELSTTDWFFPAALALVELRYAKSTLHEISDVEKDAIRKFYGLHNLPDKKHLEYYRSGTTSIIFISGEKAVKIVRPVYVLDQEVASLDKYIKEYFAAPLAPGLTSAEPTVLVMEYIKGPTLEEVLREGAMELPRARKLSLVRALGEVIGQLHRQEFPHGDLNPRNIIVEELSDDRCSLRLIDYGYNYSLTKPVLSAQSYRDSVRYIAASPNENLRDAYLDDLYSVSVIILDVWFGNMTAVPSELLHDLTVEQPLLAFILEDCLVDRPEWRMKKLQHRQADARTRANYFAAAVELACSTRVQNRTPDENTSLISVIRSSPMELFLPAKDDDEARYVLDNETNKRLNFFRKLSIAVTAFSAGTIVAVGLESYWGQGGFFTDLRSTWYQAGLSFTPPTARFWDVLPGLAISMSFLLLATKYYLSIFSSAAPDRESGFGSGLANLTMRMNAFAYSIPIAYCYLLDPKVWPFCAAIGLLIVASNNIATFRMVRKIRRSDFFDSLALARSTDAKSAYKIFSGWGTLVSLYALGVFVVGIVLVTSGSAQNHIVERYSPAPVSYNVYEYLLAASVIGINYFKMQRENCGKQAPMARALVQRYIETAKTHRAI